MAHTENSTPLVMHKFLCNHNISQKLLPLNLQNTISIFGVFERECVKNNPYTSEELKQNTEMCTSRNTDETFHLIASDMRR